MDNPYITWYRIDSTVPSGLSINFFFSNMHAPVAKRMHFDRKILIVLQNPLKLCIEDQYIMTRKIVDMTRFASWMTRGQFRLVGMNGGYQFHCDLWNWNILLIFLLNELSILWAVNRYRFIDSMMSKRRMINVHVLTPAYENSMINI